MSTTPKLAMAYLVASQAQKEVTHNDALNDLDYLTHLAFNDRTLATPPAAPSAGDVYLIAASPTGAWSGQVGKIAAYYSGWIFKTPVAGMIAWLKNENRTLLYNGTSWVFLDASFLETTFTWAPGTLTNGSGATSSGVTVTDAAFGDYVQVAAPYDLQGVVATAYVNAANTVVVRLQNQTGASVTLASGTWRVRVTKG